MKTPQPQSQLEPSTKPSPRFLPSKPQPVQTVSSTETSALRTALSAMSARERLLLISSLQPQSQPQLPQPDAPLPPTDSNCTADDDDTIDTTAIDAEVDRRVAADLSMVIGIETKVIKTKVPSGLGSAPFVTWLGNSYLLNITNQGTADGQILGVQTRLRSVHVKWLAHANPGAIVSQLLRFVIVRDKQGNQPDIFDTAQPTTALMDDYYNSTVNGQTAILAFQNWEAHDYSHILHDETILLQKNSDQIASNSDYRHGQVKIDLHNMRSQCDNTGIPLTNLIRLMVWSNINPANDPPYFRFTAQVEYTDA